MLERILELMKDKNINKNQLSKLTNLPRTTIYSALSSEESCKKASIETMRPIAGVLNTTLDYIITGIDSLPSFENYVVIYEEDGSQRSYQFGCKRIDTIKFIIEKLYQEEQEELEEQED